MVAQQMLLAERTALAGDGSAHLLLRQLDGRCECRGWRLFEHVADDAVVVTPGSPLSATRSRSLVPVRALATFLMHNLARKSPVGPYAGRRGWKRPRQEPFT